MTSTHPEPTDLALPNGWHLISCGAQQLSVAPDGLIMFPRHATPTQIPDYLGALTLAADVGTQIINAPTQPAAPALPTANAILSTGGPPAGAVALPRTTIGSPKGRQRR